MRLRRGERRRITACSSVEVPGEPSWSKPRLKQGHPEQAAQDELIGPSPAREGRLLRMIPRPRGRGPCTHGIPTGLSRPSPGMAALLLPESRSAGACSAPPGRETSQATSRTNGVKKKPHDALAPWAGGFPAVRLWQKMEN